MSTLPTPPAADPLKIKKIEGDLKAAYQSARYADVKKLAEEIKKIDPANHLADRLLEKTIAAEQEQLKKANAKQISLLEKQIKDAFSEGKLEMVDPLAAAIKKLDPADKVVRNIENQIEKARIALEAEAKQEKIKSLTGIIENGVENKKWEEVIQKANELLTIEWNHKAALKALKKAAEEKKMDIAKLITVAEPPEKPGFFARLFGKKEEKKTEEKKTVVVPPTVKMEVKPAEVKTEVKPVEKTAAPIAAKPAEVKPMISPEITKEIKPEVKIAMPPVVAKPAEAKPGFFARLFGKKEEQKNTVVPATKTEVKPAEVKTGVKPAEKTVIPIAAKPAEIKPAIIPMIKPEIKSEKPAVIPSAAVKPAEVKPAVAPAITIETKPAEVKPTVMLMVKTETKTDVKPEVKPMEIKAYIKPIEKTIAKFPPITTTALIPEKKEPGKISNLFSSITKTAVGLIPTKEKTAAAPKTANSIQVNLNPKTEKEAEKGNLFTKLFGKKEEKPASSIIDTIIAQKEKTKEEDKQEMRRERIHKKEESAGEGFLKFAHLFLRFSIVFILLSAGFFYTYNIDEKNRVMSVFGQESYALRLKKAAETVEVKKEEEKKLNEEVDRYKKGYENEHKKTIEKIVSNRMNWPDLMKRLKEVTESVYEKNSLTPYVQYSNYAFDAEQGVLTVTGTLSDPLGKNLTKLAELEEAFTYYPKDKNNPKDETKPYFYNMQEFNAFAKAFNKATGRFTSTFSLRLATKEQKK